ncbi:MAG TPA: hypothetical protein VF139_04885 [Candidatus Polarisedimenticolaceae bacterium]
MPKSIILAAALVFAGPAAAASPDPVLSEVAALLRDGRFDAADRTLRERPGSGTPARAFFTAFVTYWRLVYDEENPALHTEFEERLHAAIKPAEARLGSDPTDPDALLWAGTSRLLLAQFRAQQDQPFAAAREAKRARKLLEAARAAGRDLNAEPLFGLGAYNYAADRLPAIVKGLRALLALPGGNREEGLAQLSRAAAESRYFSLESRIVLATLYSRKHERRYDLALEETSKALASFPDSIVAHHGAARLNLSLARLDVAAAHCERALARARSLGDVDPAVLGTVESILARADLAAFRVEAARERAAALVARRPALPRDVLQTARDVVGESDALLGRPAWKGMRRGTPQGPPDAERLVALASEPAADPVIALMAGRALIARGDGAGASKWLAAAEKSRELPSWLLGPCRLAMGQAADLQGLRSKALACYRKAADGPSFPGRDAAYFLSATPFSPGS